MVTRHLIKLLNFPDNTIIKAKDSIYNYDLRICESEDKSDFFKGKWIRVTISGSGSFSNSICFFPEIRTTKKEDFWNRRDYVKYDYPAFTTHTSLGMLRLHTEDTPHGLYSIELIPRGSFKEYVQKELR